MKLDMIYDIFMSCWKLSRRDDLSDFSSFGIDDLVFIAVWEDISSKPNTLTKRCASSPLLIRSHHRELGTLSWTLVTVDKIVLISDRERSLLASKETPHDA